MRHRVKKIKLKKGYDYSHMVMRQLTNNFIVNGKITTTVKKAKYLKSAIERIVGKAKEKKESNINYLKSHLDNEKTIKMLFDDIGPRLSKDTGGYVRIIKLTQRTSDGAEIARIEWSKPVVAEEKKEVKKKEEKTKK